MVEKYDKAYSDLQTQRGVNKKAKGAHPTQPRWSFGKTIEVTASLLGNLLESNEVEKARKLFHWIQVKVTTTRDKQVTTRNDLLDNILRPKQEG